MNVKRKIWIKAISVFLAVLMVMQILPMTVFAKEKSNIESLNPSIAETEPAKIDCELENERDEFSKTYLLEDGTYATYVSRTPIHTESSNGKWQDISKIAVPETMEELQSELSTNSNNGIATQSADTTNSNQSVTSEFDDMTIQSIGNGLTGVNDEELRIQDYDENDSQIRSVGYVKLNELNLPNIGDACIVTKATLGAYCSTLPGSKNNIVIAQTVEDEWPKANSQTHNFSESIMDYNAIDLSDEEYYEWDITEAACKWSNKLIDNNGIALSPYDIDCKVSAYVDNIVMYYSVVNELDENFSFHSVDMGRAGTAYVNDFTNDFYLVRNELSLDSNIMPVNVTRTYNNTHKNDTDVAGLGWHLNYHSSLSKVKISKINFFKWIKDNGSVVYFEKKNNKWVEQGVEEGYTVTEAADYNIISSDNEDYQYCYGKTNKKLEKVIDKNNNSITLDYDNSYIISKVIDGNSRNFNFNLGTFGTDKFINKLSVSDSSNNSIQLDEKDLSLSYGYSTFSGSKRLGTVTYADNKKVNYEYDDNGNMTVIKNIDGSSLKVEYKENGKVKKYTKYASDEKTILDTVTFDSSEAYQRIFTDKNNKTTRQQYDSQLNQVSEVTDSDGYFKQYDENNKLQSISVTEEHTNLLKNPDFSDKLSGWNYPSQRNIEVTTDENNGFKLSKYDKNVVKIPGKYNAQKYVRQLYTFDDNEDHKDELYTAGVWAKINGSISRKDELNDGKTRTAGVLINGYTNNESGETISPVLASITFDNSISDWQYMMVTFKLDENYDGIQFALSYNYQLGDAYFDGATLYKSTQSSLNSENDITTCPCKNCSEPNCPCNCKDESNCKHIWCKRGTTTVENSNGLVTKETTTDTVSSMRNSYAYDDNNYYLTQSTDENGTVTYYTYDSNTGKLTSMATGNVNNKINYTYNAVGLLKTVSQTVTNIVSGEKVNMLSEYTYDGDTLSQISHNGSVYSFDYDKYGNVKNVKISGHSLAEYSYNNSEQIGYILYGNGDKINYTYNLGGNITSISTQKANEESDDLVEYLYEYDSNNKLVSYTDNINKTVTAYTDDGYSIISQADDTIIYSSKKSDNSDETSIDLFGYTFSQNKSKDAYDIETAQTTASTKYTLPCDTLNITGIGQSFTVTDYYGRNISSTFKISTDDELKVDDINVNQYEYVSSNNYKYKTDENNVTTNLVDSYTSSIELHYILTDEEKAEIQEALDNNEVTKEEVDEYYASLNKTLNSLTTHYEYDNAGRITKIFTDGELSALYQYDEAGQLTEEIDKNGATQYTYDAGGNITTKIHYDNVEYDDKNNDYILGEATKVTNYTYNNDGWSDLLTSVDGTKIQYDDMGNPLNYQGTDYYNETINASLTWNGRLLTSLVLDENSGLAKNDKYDYSYNADGLRTEKRRYKWDDNKSSYYLYQLDEYVWENNILKGYKISYPGLADSNSYIVFPLYDDNNEIIGVSYKIILNSSSSSSSSDRNATENVLYFVKDAQGNIQKMVDQINDYEFIYKYDAYGKLISFTIPKEETRINNMPEKTFWDQLAKGIARTELAATYSVYKEINPFAYRSYFYDGETGLYYNQSRYYSPEWCRFINADDPMLTDTATGTPNANNMFAYCENDPINSTDDNGYLAITASVVYFGIAVATLFSLTMFYVTTTSARNWSGLSLKSWTSKRLTIAKRIPVAIFSGIILLAKRSKLSQKARATDAPSWIFEKPPHDNEKAKDYAKRILDQKYGKGNWKKGPGSEYNKIVKYAQRNLGMK